MGEKRKVERRLKERARSQRCFARLHPAFSLTDRSHDTLCGWRQVGPGRGGAGHRVSPLKHAATRRIDEVREESPQSPHFPVLAPAPFPIDGPGEKLRGTAQGCAHKCTQRSRQPPMRSKTSGRRVRRAARATDRAVARRAASCPPVTAAVTRRSPPPPPLQAFKFALYVTIPAVLTLAVATNADVLNKVIKQVRREGEKARRHVFFFPLPFDLALHLLFRRSLLSTKTSYVVYPPEGPRPPSPESVHSLARDNARK